MEHASPQPNPDTSAIDESLPGEMTPQELAEAKQYGRQKIVLHIVDKLLNLAYLALFAFGFAWPADAWLAARVPNSSLRLMAMFGLVVGIFTALTFPLDYYAGYVLEHRYGLSRQTFAQWLWKELKQFALALGFGALLVLGLFWLIWTTGSMWWLAAAAGVFVVSIVLGQLAPVLILPLFYKVERLDNPELTKRMSRLAAGTGLTIEGVYRLVLSEETSKANAMLAGLGRTRRVLLGDTLLDGFTPEEIEVVFAHEVGHHVFHHIPKLIGASFVVSMAGFWLSDRWLAAWLGAEHYNPADLPVAALPMLIFVLTALGTLAEPLQNAVSRRYERQCDRYALRSTGMKAAYLSAFRKLARLNKSDPDPNPIAVFFLHSHPPIAERLALADE
jgi:STE24 endopeptidase